MTDRNGGTNENKNRQRLDQMEDVIQSMITLVLEQGKLSDKQHEQTMAEIRAQRAEHRQEHAAFLKTLREQHAVFSEEVQGLITLQKEHRIDIMALFEGQKNLREGKKNG
jgi:hypothetical protein